MKNTIVKLRENEHDFDRINQVHGFKDIILIESNKLVLIKTYSYIYRFNDMHA